MAGCSGGAPVDETLAERDFLVLSREVKALAGRTGWLEAHGVELLIFGLRGLLFAAGYALCARGGRWPFVGGLLVMSYAYYGIGITGVHEASHGSFVDSAWGNRLWSYFFSDFWSAQSSDWWYHRHVVLHHAHTNVPEKDPPLFTYPWLDKRVYFFAAPYLVAFWLVIHSALFLRRRPAALALYLTLWAAGWAFHVWLFARLLPLGAAVLAAFVMRSLFAPVFMHLAVFNHSGLDSPRERRPWLPHQSRTTRNLKRHWFLTGIGGNAFVECHLEHHLFPSLSNRLLAAIRPLVRARLQEAGYSYVEQGYWDCLQDNLDHYDAYSSPIAA